MTLYWVLYLEQYTSGPHLTAVGHPNKRSAEDKANELFAYNGTMPIIVKGTKLELKNEPIDHYVIDEESGE